MTATLHPTTAVITGASSGIGAATAKALADQGAHVVLLARRRERLEGLAAEINNTREGQASTHELDVAHTGAVSITIDQIACEHGGVDVLVNSVGYGMWEPAGNAAFTHWQQMIEVNLTGVLACTHAALPHLTEAACGPRGVADLVTISSIAGRKVPTPESNVYGATKHALGAFSEALRQELAEHHVRVGLVEPGVTVSELTTRGGNNAPDATSASELEVLQPHDVADAVIYMVTRPCRTAVNEILVRPLEQTV